MVSSSASEVCQSNRVVRADAELGVGQLPQNIALRLKQTGVNVLGTDPEKIDSAEDRHKFSSILDSIGVDQPEWAEVSSVDAAKEFAQRVGCVYLRRSVFAVC